MKTNKQGEKSEEKIEATVGKESIEACYINSEGATLSCREGDHHFQNGQLLERLIFIIDVLCATFFYFWRIREVLL